MTRRGANSRWGFAALALAFVVGPAMAQPTGNPKGTAAPAAEGSSSKSPATRNRAAQQEDRRSDSATKQDSRAVRSGHLRTPGTGTSGGLSGRHPGDGSATGTTQTNQAPPATKP